MQINLSELFVCEGKEKHYQVPVEMEKLVCNMGEFPIAEKTPAELIITHIKDRKLKICGSVDLHLEIPCDRCLEAVDVPMSLEIDQEIDMSLTEEERQKLLDEQPYVKGYELDVDRLICGELVVNMPVKVLCKEDCKGICNRCGANLNYETCSCDVTELDPRMSVICDIFNQNKEASPSKVSKKSKKKK